MQARFQLAEKKRSEFFALDLEEENGSHLQTLGFLKCLRLTQAPSQTLSNPPPTQHGTFGGSATTTDPSEVQQRCKTQNVTKGNGRRDRTECQQESPNGLKMPLSCCKKQQTYLLRDSSSNSWQDQDVPNSHCIMCHTEYSMISPSQDVDSKNHCHPSLQGQA